MRAEKRLLPIAEAFQLAQQPHPKRAKLVGALSRTCRWVSAPDPEHPPRFCRPPPSWSSWYNCERTLK